MNGTMAGRLFSRRGFLTVGAAGFGLTLGDFFRLQAAEGKAPGTKEAPAKSVIWRLGLPGRPSHNP